MIVIVAEKRGVTVGGYVSSGSRCWCHYVFCRSMNVAVLEVWDVSGIGQDRMGWEGEARSDQVSSSLEIAVF